MPNINPKIKGWARVIIVIILFFILGSIFDLMGLIVADVDYRLDPIMRKLDQNLVISYFHLASNLIVIYFCVRVIDREKIISIGLNILKRSNDIFIGILLGFLIMGFALTILSYTNQIKLLDVNFNAKNIMLLTLLFVNISFSEEILMRGYILRNLLYSFNPFVALTLSAFIFSIFHGLNPNINFIGFINLFLAGIMLGLSYLYTKNLWFPIALHFSWNFFQSLFGFNVSGVNSYSLIEFKIIEPNIMNGGYFGFEGSVLSIIVQAFLILSIFFYYNHKTKKDIFKK